MKKKNKEERYSRDKFISPRSYIRKPTVDINERNLSKVENIEQYTKVQELQKKQQERYDMQQSKIAVGQMPSKLNQEVNAFLRKDPYKRVKQPKPQVAPMYSKEQNFMRTFFGHGDHVIFGSKDSESLPKMNGALMPYEHGDESESGTAESFGLGRIKRKTGLY